MTLNNEQIVKNFVIPGREAEVESTLERLIGERQRLNDHIRACEELLEALRITTHVIDGMALRIEDSESIYGPCGTVGMSSRGTFRQERPRSAEYWTNAQTRDSQRVTYRGEGANRAGGTCSFGAMTVDEARQACIDWVVKGEMKVWASPTGDKVAHWEVFDADSRPQRR